MKSFSEKVCIITGGASGLGRELGTQLAKEGAVVVLADIDRDRLATAANEIARGGGKARAVPTDVTDPESVRELVEGTVKELGRIDFFSTTRESPSSGRFAT